MKKSRLATCILVLFSVFMLNSCSGTMHTIAEMELSQNYSPSDPFVHENLFSASSDIEEATLEVTFQMDGETGLLEIADNQSNEILWSQSWSGTIENSTFSVSLDSLVKEKEYVVRFTGTKIHNAKILVASDNRSIKAQERPKKSK